MEVYEKARPHGGTQTAEVEYGYLLPHATTVQGSYATRLLAAANARLTSNNFTLMRTTPHGWRSLDGATADEIATRKMP